MNSCARRFQPNYMEEQFPDPGEPITFYQMNPQVWAFQQGFQDNNLQFHEFPGVADSYRMISSGFRESATREVDGSSGEGTLAKLGRFKVKTVQFGQVVKEEAK